MVPCSPAKRTPYGVGAACAGDYVPPGDTPKTRRVSAEREFTRSRLYTFRRWVETVAGRMRSLLAISVLLSPEAANRAICS